MRRRISSDVAEQLRSLIRSDFPPGSRLPRETELAESLGVSRNTLREAISELVLTGDIERRWGIGTFVREREQAVTLSLAYIQPIDEVLRMQGRRFALEHVTASLEPASRQAARALGISDNDRVWHCERIFSVDGTRFALLRDVVPTSIAGHAVDLSGFSSACGGLVSVLEAQLGLRVDRMEGEVGIAIADDDVERALGVAAGHPTFRLDQLLEASGTPLASSTVLYRPDLVRLSYFRSAADMTHEASARADDFTTY